MIYELKKCQAHPGKFDQLVTRFGNVTLPIFDHLGINVHHCWTCPDHACMSYYLVSFDSQAAQLAAWETFGADAKWKKAKAESEVNGPLLASESAVKFTPTNVSPEG